MKIRFGEDEGEIQLSEQEANFKFGGKWDILQLKNAFLSNVEKSFDEEVISLIKAGAFKYKD